MQRSKKEWWKSKYIEIEQLELSNRYQEMHDRTKKITGTKKKNILSDCIGDNKDSMLFEENDIRKRWEKNCFVMTEMRTMCSMKRMVKVY